MMHFLQWLVLGVVPWWCYVVASLAVAVVIIVYLPNRLGLVLGFAASLIVGNVGWTAKGYELGADAKDAEWQALRSKELARLVLLQAQVESSERARAQAASDYNALLERQVTEATKGMITDANGNPPGAVCITADGARRLRNIGAGAGGGTNGAAKRARGPITLPRVFRFGN